MLNIPHSTKIFLNSSPIDLRKGFDSLANMVKNNGLDPYSGDLFVFFSKRRTHIKILSMGIGGFIIFYKRLEISTFKTPPPCSATQITLSPAQLYLLLDGFPFQQLKPPKLWAPPQKNLQNVSDENSECVNVSM